MKFVVLKIVLCAFSASFVDALSSDEVAEVKDTCWNYAEGLVATSVSVAKCKEVSVPEEIEPDQQSTCKAAIKSCCEQYFKDGDECDAGIKFAPKKQCSSPNTEIGKECCQECNSGKLTGETNAGNADACGSLSVEGILPSAALRKKAYYQCCLKAAQTPTTTPKPVLSTSTTEKLKATCKNSGCEHNCDDEGGVVRCSCKEGFRLQGDKKSCIDINECAETLDDLCTVEDTVCHNVPGAFKCVPVKKREVGLSCPPGFKRNVVNQVCDDINECQLPRPPCAKYICENTIGGYKCAGKSGKPFEEAVPGAPAPVTESATTPLPRTDICPPGFRAGDDDECLDIDECGEKTDDCQHLSQHCINTHGSFFCQDHVSKRCLPGFKVNSATGICEDIDECEESSEVCKRNEVCINFPGAYNCKSKISQLPKLATKNCQEGTRLRPGGKVCEDIDECREGTHLCDQFQNCINTFGAHECRCKNGFELDFSLAACVDINECALKLDNCGPGLYCQNSLGSFACTRKPPQTTPSPTTISTTPAALYDYEYYDSNENTTDDKYPETKPTMTSSTTTRPSNRPITRLTPGTTPRTTTRTTTRSPRPTYSTRPNTLPLTTSTTPRTPRPYPPYPDRRYYTTSTTTRQPFTNTVETTPKPIPTTSRSESPNYIPTEKIDTEENSRPTYETQPSRPVYPEYSRRPVYPRRTTRKPEPPRRIETTAKPTTTERNSVIDDTRMFNPNEVHCLYGYEKDANGNCIEIGTSLNRPLNPKALKCLNGYESDIEGNCVDIDECKSSRHVCGSLEQCLNRAGGYTCECVSGYTRGDDGWCIPATTTSTTTTTTTTSTTLRPAENNAVSTPEWAYNPYMPHTSYGSRHPPVICELGYRFDSSQQKCVDIDECDLDKNRCAREENCVNIDGGFKCVCGTKCRAENEKPSYVPPAVQPASFQTPEPEGNVITVGAQYGQRGPWSPRPTYSRDPHNGSIMTACPWGYKLTPDKRCYDIDECATNSTVCGPQQRCENFYGGYSCQCGAGHRLVGQNECADIDECMHGNPCSYNSQCINTVGSYRCQCSEGFRNAATNDKVCVDVDECTETPQVCHQGCANAWGSYRCYCKRGYRLSNDTKTCVDVNECDEWSSVRLRGKLCRGECLNEPGSYRCACPAGYRLSEDQRSCIDIDECETGEASCARSSGSGLVCQNTRGSYHCHQIECPSGYRLESKHRCTRITKSCRVSDWSCLQQPSTYSYNFITFVANIYLPSGSVDLFTMHGPAWVESVVSFEMRMVNVQPSPGVKPADLSCFDMRPTGNICAISLLCSLEGPQVAELELTMSLYQRGQFAGSAVARLVIIVSQFEF